MDPVSLERGSRRGRCTAALITLVIAGCVSYGRVTTDGKGLEASGGVVTMPAGAPSIIQGFRPPAHKEPDHRGIDIVGPRGLPVIAPADGVVVDVARSPMYGNMVTIDHGRDEAGRQTTTRFLHLDESHVSGGERVARGDLIGDLGRTGLLAGGIPHLHFEVHRTGPQGRPGPVNPHLYWTDGVGVVTCFDKARRWAVDGLRMTYPVPCRDVPWR